MTIAHFYASEAHYAEHLLPIWNLQGCLAPFYGNARRVAPFLARRGIYEMAKGLPPRDALVVVASFQDLRMMKRAAIPAILLEHGAGQSYEKEHPSFSGGKEREHASLFLCPSEEVAMRNSERYPEIPSAVIGCPKLDPYVYGVLRKPIPDKPTLAISFHWENRLVPESRSALSHYQSMLPELASRHRVIGHGHPRAWKHLAPLYEAAGIELVEDFTEVLVRADLYICDNSSTLFEFAAVKGPVLLLDAPWYRRDVEQGLRFWERADIGVRVSGPEHLFEGIAEALTDPPGQQQIRERRVAETYAYLDGEASRRAIEAIELIASEGRLERAEKPPQRARRAMGTTAEDKALRERLASHGASPAVIGKVLGVWARRARREREMLSQEILGMSSGDLRLLVKETESRLAGNHLTALTGVPEGVKWPT